MLGWAKFDFSVIGGLVAACWAFFRWTKAREKEREKERKRLAALYVNPFLLACEQLQSRLFNILDKKGLSALRNHYPDEDYAEEILYLIAQYFAWERCFYRYTPYAQDPEVIRLTETIRQIFATDSLGVGAFCFYRPEQGNLGRLLLERAGGEFDVISFHAFKESLVPTHFLGSSSIAQTLQVLKDSKSMDELISTKSDVRKRLARIQSRLVDLLSHIECQEGITFFFSEDNPKRLKAKEDPKEKDGA